MQEIRRQAKVRGEVMSAVQERHSGLVRHRIGIALGRLVDNIGITQRAVGVDIGDRRTHFQGVSVIGPLTMPSTLPPGPLS